MSGKFEKKRAGKKPVKRRFRCSFLIILVLILAAAAVFLLPKEEMVEESTVPTEKSESTEGGTQPTETMPREEYLFSIDSNVKIKEISAYSGLYMEDGSGDSVENVMQILVKNMGDESLQYAKITLLADDEEAVFEMTTLMPGESMVVLEKNRKVYSEDIEYTALRTDNLAYFQYEPKLQKDKLSIQPLDGGFNIKNISKENIDGKIVIYYKDYQDGQYLGGITYSGTIKDGMEAGEIRQIMSKHFSADNTKIVFVNIG